jgi:hypothetical protein
VVKASALASLYSLFCLYGRMDVVTSARGVLMPLPHMRKAVRVLVVFAHSVVCLLRRLCTCVRQEAWLRLGREVLPEELSRPATTVLPRVPKRKGDMKVVHVRVPKEGATTGEDSGDDGYGAWVALQFLAMHCHALPCTAMHCHAAVERGQMSEELWWGGEGGSLLRERASVRRSLLCVFVCLPPLSRYVVQPCKCCTCGRS